MNNLWLSAGLTLVLNLMMAPAWGLPTLDAYALPKKTVPPKVTPTKPGAKDLLPNLDNYAVDNSHDPDSFDHEQLLTGMSTFQVLGNQSLLLSPGVTTTIPVSGQFNGRRLTNAKLVGYFISENAASGRFILTRLLSPGRAYLVEGETDLLPARVEDLASIGNDPARSSRNRYQQTADLINATNYLIGHLGYYNPYYSQAVEANPFARATQRSQSKAIYQELQRRQQQGQTVLISEVQPGQSLRVTFTSVR